jgi:hypothetical protein
VIAVTSSFDGLGFDFLYPDNWEIQKEGDADWPRTVSVHSPAGAFISMTLFLKSTAPADLLDQTLAAMRAEYEEIELQSTKSSVPGFEDQVAYEADFYCLDLVVTARVCQYEFGDFVLLAMYQGESRDFEKLLQVFDAVALSTLQNLAKGN